MNHSEYMVNANNFTATTTYKSSILQTDMFTGGLQQDISHAHTAIANFLCMLYVIYDIDQRKPKKFPLLVQQLHTILNMSYTHEFMQWYHLSFPSQPWIPHVFLTFTHNVIRSHAAIAKTPKYQDAYSRGVLGDHTEAILKEVSKPYDHLVQALESVGVNDTGSFYWQQMPVAWRVAYPKIVAQWEQQVGRSLLGISQPSALSNMAVPIQNQAYLGGGYSTPIGTQVSQAPQEQRQRGSRRNRDYKTLGWIQSRQKVPYWPPALERICPHFAFVGNECTTKQCPKLHMYYSQLKPEEKQAAERFVADTPGVSFNEDVTTCGKHALPRKERNKN